MDDIEQDRILIQILFLNSLREKNQSNVSSLVSWKKDILSASYELQIKCYFTAETKANLKQLQAVENIGLRVATGAPWLIRNVNIYRELQFAPFREVIAKRGVALPGSRSP